MNYGTQTLLAVAAWLAVAGGASAAEPPAARPVAAKERVCTSRDLVGHVWKMVLLKENPPRKETVWYTNAPYQYLTFYPENQYGYIASNIEITKPEKLSELIRWPQWSKHLLQYRLDDHGLLDLYLDKVLQYRYRCMYVLVSHDMFLERDVILNGFSMKYKKGTVYKLYRYWY